MRRPTLRQTARAAALLLWLAGNAVVWYLLPLVPRLTLPVSHPQAQAHAFSPDGRWLLTSGYGDPAEPVRLWDVYTGATRDVHPVNSDAPTPPARLMSARFSADGRRLVWDDADDTVHLFDLESERELAVFRWPVGPMPPWSGNTTLAAPDPDTVLAANYELVLWEVPTGRVRLHVSTNGTGLLLMYDLSPDGKLLATATTAALQVWDVATGREVWAVRGDKLPPIQVRFSPDGRLLAGGLAWQTDPKAIGWKLTARDASNGQIRWQQRGTPMYGWTGDGHLAGLIGPPPTRVLFWDGATGEERAAASAPGTQFLYSADATAGPLLLVPGYRVYLSMNGWPSWAARIVARLLGHGPPDFECRLLDATTGRVVATYPDVKEYRYAEYGRTAMLSPDGRTVLTVSRDNAIQLWDVPPRKPWPWFVAAVAGQLAAATLLRSVAKRRRG